MRPFILRTLYPVVVVVLVAGLARTSLVRANESKPAVSADEALKMLTEGNVRFVAGKPEHPHANAERRTETAQKGQHPFAIVLSCADSRVPVELIFDQGIGDVFVLRVAGNVCGVDETATIEYAAEHLGSPLLVVMGHSKCGAVTAVATDAKLEGRLPELAKLIKPGVDAAQKAHPDLHGEALVPEATKANVWYGIESVLKESPLIVERVKTGKLTIVGALCDIADGKVEWLGPHPNQKRLLAEAPPTEHPQASAENAGQAASETPAASHAPTTRPAAQHAPAPVPAPARKAAEAVPNEAIPPAPAVAAPQTTVAVGLLERCTAEELCRQGGVQIERGRYTSAAERFRAALELDPSMLAAMNDLAGVHYVQRDYAGAAKLYSAVLTKDPAYRPSLRGVALVYATQGQYPQSRDVLQRLLMGNDRDAQAWLDLGDVLFLMKDAAGARQHWTRAAEVDLTARQVVARAQLRLETYASGGPVFTSASR